MRVYAGCFAKKKSQTATAKARQGNKTKKRDRQRPVFNSSRRRSDTSRLRTGTEQAGAPSSMSILIGAGLIAAAILLSTLISAVGSRYAGLESPADDTAWLVDRLTGSVYKCQANEAGRASCKSGEIATGSIPKNRP